MDTIRVNKTIICHNSLPAGYRQLFPIREGSLNDGNSEKTSLKEHKFKTSRMKSFPSAVGVQPKEV